MRHPGQVLTHELILEHEYAVDDRAARLGSARPVRHWLT